MLTLPQSKLVNLDRSVVAVFVISNPSQDQVARPRLGWTVGCSCGRVLPLQNAVVVHGEPVTLAVVYQGQVEPADGVPVHPNRVVLILQVQKVTEKKTPNCRIKEL